MRVTTLLVAALLLIPGVAAAQSVPTDPDQPGDPVELSLTMSVSPDQPGLDEPVDISMSVRNDGETPASDVFVYLSLPPEIAYNSYSGLATCEEITYDEPYPGAETPPPGDTDGGGGDAPVYGGTSLQCSIPELLPGTAVDVTVGATRVSANYVYLYANAYSNGSENNYDDNYAYLDLEPDYENTSDLSLTMSSPADVEVGGSFAYTFEVSNAGPVTAHDVVVVDPIYDGIDALSVTPDTCAIEEEAYGEEGYSYTYTQMVCALGDMEPGDQVTITLNATRTSAWEIWNSAWVSSSSYDVNYENDYAYASMPADPSVTSDVSVKVTSSANAPLVGDTFDLFFDVMNSGPSVAGDVVVNQMLPEGIEFASSEDCRLEDYSYKEPAPYAPETGVPSGGAPEDDGASPIYYGGETVVCEPGLLEPGQTASLSVSVTRTRAWELWNWASVYASNYDPNWENNYSELYLAADKSHPADISVQMTAPEDVAMGEDFQFEITVTNNGPETAGNVWMADGLPYGLNITSVTPEDACELYQYEGYELAPADSDPSFYGYSEVRCDFGEMAAGESRTVAIGANRTSEWEIWNSAWAWTSAYDSNWENDYAYVSIGGEDPYGDCSKDAEGTPDDDSIAIGDCPVDSGAGADEVSLYPSSDDGTRSARTGRGNDNIDLNISSGSAGLRTFEIDSGGGSDHISITVGPSGENARIVVDAGKGDDSIDIDVAPSVRSVRIVIRGQDGNDTVRMIRYRNGRVLTRTKLIGGAGGDMLIAGDGDDLLTGGRGRDELSGGAGDDWMSGGRGKDTCSDGPGDDTVNC